jgi:NADPH-dependent 7-cyano-7-deazaguanine reductase QueF-like protein
MMQKHMLLQSLTKSIVNRMNGADGSVVYDIKEIKYQIHSGSIVDKDWELFKLYFEQVNDEFFDKLKEINHALTSNDYKRCA